MAKIYSVAGSVMEEVVPNDGKKFSLEEAQAIVDGYVELIHLEGDDILLCDEEGLIKNKPVNIMATKHAKQLGWRGDFLVGNVMFLKNGEF